MFQFLQNHLKKIFGFLLIFIIPSFCLYFVGGTGNSSQIVGKLYGKKISQVELERSYKAAYLEAAMMYGAYFKNIAPYLNLEKNAWERLMLLYKADMEKIKVGADDVRKNILEFYKKISGKEEFDSNSYKYFVNTNLNMDLKAFEEMMANTLKINKLREKTTEHINVNDDEVEKYYIEENNKLQFSYIKFSASDFMDKVVVEEEELKKAFTENRNSFIIEDKVSVKYIFISPRDYEDKADITEEKLKSFYEENKDDYILDAEAEEKNDNEPELEETATAVPDEVGEQKYKAYAEVKDEIKKKIIKTESEAMADEFADKIYREMVEKNNFSEIVEKYKIHTETTELFTKKNPPALIGSSASSQVRDAFELASGDFAGPYNHKNGWLLISVNEKITARVPEKLDEVKDKVTDFVKLEKSPGLAEIEAKEFRQKIKPLLDKKTFEEAAKQLSLKVSVSGMINRKTVMIRGLGTQKDIVEKAFQLKEDELSEILSFNKNKDFLFMQITRRTEADMQKFAESKKSVAERALAEKKKNYYVKWLKDLEKEADWQIRMPAENKA